MESSGNRGDFHLKVDLGTLARRNGGDYPRGRIIEVNIVSGG